MARSTAVHETAAIRAAHATDLGALYAIALSTGDRGEDATGLHEDTRMVGHIYAAPYPVADPGLCFVLEDADGVAGYVVGTLDTLAFEAWCEAHWWPGLRAQYPDPDEAGRSHWTADQRRAHIIHHPEANPPAVVEVYPAHVHMNLLPRRHREGWGTRLLDTWLQAAVEAGAPRGVHVGTNSQNRRAYAFWRSQGFVPLNERYELPPSRTDWLGRPICGPT